MMTSARQMAMRRSRVQTLISCRSRLCEEPKLSGDAVSEVVEEKGDAWGLGESPGGVGKTPGWGRDFFRPGFQHLLLRLIYPMKFPPAATPGSGKLSWNDLKF